MQAGPVVPLVMFHVSPAPAAVTWKLRGMCVLRFCAPVMFHAHVCLHFALLPCVLHTTWGAMHVVVMVVLLSTVSAPGRVLHHHDEDAIQW